LSAGGGGEAIAEEKSGFIGPGGEGRGRREEEGGAVVEGYTGLGERGDIGISRGGVGEGEVIHGSSGRTASGRSV
jgi:hypothetical protein